MKDEETAEEHKADYGIDLCCLCRECDVGNINPCQHKKDAMYGYKDGFLAGLKAGRPQWHKVADGDLPTTVGRRFLVSNRYCTMIGYWNGRTFVSADEDTTEIASPIAWCEIPTFDKE